MFMVVHSYKQKPRHPNLIPILRGFLESNGFYIVLNGGQGRNRTGVDGFAGRSITTLPPGLREEFPDTSPEARYSTIGRATMLCVR